MMQSSRQFLLPNFSLLFIFAFAFTCSKTNKQAAEANAAVPTDLVIQFGEGGGFTGMWQGYTIHADGAVFSWQGRAVGEQPDEIGKLSQNDIQALWHEVQSADFFAQSLSQTGNMTTIFRITANEKQHEVTWAATSAQAQPQVAALQQLQAQCQKLIDSVKKQ